MAKAANFNVDPKLASLLGESYRSSEEALRELVDNAWDADASKVTVNLPGAVEGSPIVVHDDGSGMTEQEVRSEYLRIASDRTTRKGDRTPGKRRKVKGRKGIGKFAGLMAASEMRVETWARGTKTSITIAKADLLTAREAVADLEAVAIPVATEKCDSALHGTRVTLTALNQKFELPDPEKLKAILVMEYGREDEFGVIVNDVPIALEDVPGTQFAQIIDVPGLGPTKVRFTISDGKKPLKQAGLAIRIRGKIVGRPSSLGLDSDEKLPSKLLKRIYGEIDADGLADHVTADWGAIVENSLPFQNLKAQAAGVVKRAIEATFKSEVNLAKARWEKELRRRLATLPEHRRRHAEETITKLLRKLYGDNEDRIEAVVSVTLDAFENDDYWIVLKKIDEATRGDVAKLAEILSELGLVDVAIVSQQAAHRLAFLNEFDVLITNTATLEKEIHHAIENNLWLLGSGYRLISSNKTFQTLISGWLDKSFAGANADKRPDLFLAAVDRDRHLLVEFKRPSHEIDRDDENQAAKYRDDLQPFIPNKQIEVLVVGGTRAPVATQYATTALTVSTYVALAAQAREELAWLLDQLRSDT